MGRTTFGSIDLREAKDLATIRHIGSCTVGIDTIYRSEGRIPEGFLRAAGVPRDFIEYARSLTNTPLEFYSCFICYSARDREFAERLHADLQSRGVRCWFAPDNLKIGDNLHLAIDESIRIYDKLLIILSEHSVASDWVEHEVETALAREAEQKRKMLFAICLDDAVMKIATGWPAHIKNTRNIGDFRKWRNSNAYQISFARLLKDLQATNSKNA